METHQRVARSSAIQPPKHALTVHSYNLRRPRAALYFSTFIDLQSALVKGNFGR